MNKVLEVLSTHKELVKEIPEGLVTQEIEFISADEGGCIHFWRNSTPNLIFSLKKEMFCDLLCGAKVKGYSLYEKGEILPGIFPSEADKFVLKMPKTKFDDKFEHRFWNLYQMNLMKDYNEKDALEKARYEIEKFNQDFSSMQESAKMFQEREKKERELRMMRMKGVEELPSSLPFIELDDETPF